MKKTIISVILSLLLLCSLALPISASASEDSGITPISADGSNASSLLTSAQDSKKLSEALTPALDIIAANSPMAKSGMAGNEIDFSPNDFARAMNLSKVTSLTLVSVPASHEGVLLLGSTVVSSGQTLSAASIDQLVFDPVSNEACMSSFEFKLNGCEYSTVCTLYMLDSLNANPTVATATETSLNMNGYTDTAVFGKLYAHDPEGDTLTFQIVSAPSRGLLILSDKNEGRYTYLPENGFTGKDEFTYVVYDKYGNYSSKATVKLKISDSKTSVVYADMIGKEACCAAIKMTESGIMDGTQVGELCYFSPETELTREQFLVMAMKAAGIERLPESSSTGFYDDASISVSAKPYVAAAKQLGYISGTEDKSGNLCFAPSEKISRAEAALMIDKIINAKSYLTESNKTPVFDDLSKIPDWAKDSVMTLAKLGIMTGDGNSLNSTAPLTKENAAMILARTMQLTEK